MIVRSSDCCAIMVVDQFVSANENKADQWTLFYMFRVYSGEECVCECVCVDLYVCVDMCVCVLRETIAATLDSFHVLHEPRLLISQLFTECVSVLAGR